jgi:hypothetical protein
MYIANLGCPTDFFIALAGLVSGGADTVSKKKENENTIISLIASLDFIICANAIPGDGTLS